MKCFRICLTLFVLSLMSACTTPEPEVYRGGVLIHEGPLDIHEHHSFRFVEKWRISHSWLSGPTEVWPCRYSGNPGAHYAEWKALAGESNSPIYEIDNRLFSVSRYKNQTQLYRLSDEKICGTNPNGEFRGFSPFCGHGFKDSLDGVALLIIKPDPAKGTDAWIEGAKPVTINGLHWLHKEIPIKDWSESREQFAAPIEYWVLKIPDTQYWLVLRFSASSGKKFGLGAGAHPEKHQRLLNLFHQIVHSVRLEPITPVDISPLIKEIR